MNAKSSPKHRERTDQSVSHIAHPFAYQAFRTLTERPIEAVAGYVTPGEGEAHQKGKDDEKVESITLTHKGCLICQVCAR